MVQFVCESCGAILANEGENALTDNGWVTQDYSDQDSTMYFCPDCVNFLQEKACKGSNGWD